MTTIKTSSNETSFPAYLSFDGNSDTYWKTEENYAGLAPSSYVGSTSTLVDGDKIVRGEWIEIELATRIFARKYVIRSANLDKNEGHLSSWTLVASRDGIHWETVDVVQHESNWSANNPLNFYDVDKMVESFTHFRLIVQETGHSNELSPFALAAEFYVIGIQGLSS